MVRDSRAPATRQMVGGGNRSAMRQAFLERPDRVVTFVWLARGREPPKRDDEQARVRERACPPLGFLSECAGLRVLTGAQTGNNLRRQEPDVRVFTRADLIQGALAGLVGFVRGLVLARTPRLGNHERTVRQPG